MKLSKAPGGPLPGALLLILVSLFFPEPFGLDCVVLEHLLYCNCLKCCTLGWSNLDISAKGEGKEELPWDLSLPSHRRHDKAKGSGSLSQSGVAKGPVASHTIACTGEHVPADRRDSGSVSPRMHTNLQPLQRRAHTGACSRLYTHLLLAPLLGCPCTNPHTFSSETERRSRSPSAPLPSHSSAPRGSARCWRGAVRESCFAATTFIPLREKAAASQKHPIQQNVFKYLMKE